MGSAYGRKFVSTQNLSKEIFVISAGCGEDISFDIELANKFSGIVVLVDPTPKSKFHVTSVLERIGVPGSRAYSSTGLQPVNSYDLSNVVHGQLKFVPKALWNTKGFISFFPPENPDGISYSIGNLQRTNSGVIEVETSTIPELMADYQQFTIDILKLDIEGAEFEVLKHMFSCQIFPKQILVEIDEFLFPSLKNLLKGFKVLKLIRKRGYLCISKSDDFEYTFISPLKTYEQPT